MEPVVIRPNKSIKGTRYIDTYKYKSGQEVPIYDVLNCHGLNQIIGYIKLINKSYGKVYYRGQCSLHNTMLPSLYHSCLPSEYNGRNRKLNDMIKKILNDDRFMREVNLNKTVDYASIIIEGLLQHYGIQTRCIDAVDNHWIALWFGLNKYHSERVGDIIYASYTERLRNCYQIFENEKLEEENRKSDYQYIILIAADYRRESNGVIIGYDMLTVDLRVALPSTFLRPHAQHGIILHRHLHDSTSNFDISKSVVGILRIRNDMAYSWLGNGGLVKFSNLFPSQFHDLSYRIMLERTDLFCDGKNSIVHYIYE